MNPNETAVVHFDCGRGHAPHPLCINIGRGVPPELRCATDASPGFSRAGGGCPIPNDIADRARREFRDSVEESKRRGFILVRA